MGEVGPLGETINNYGLSTTGGYYYLDGKDLFLFGNVTGNPGQSRQNVVLVEKNGEQWTDIQEQNIKSGNIVSFNADYALASRGKVMFISTLRYDTEGGRDIYISYLDRKNKWSEPMNLGRRINTAMDEFSPFYAESEGALYFSTEGFAGFGKGDIYRVVRLDSTWNNWSNAVNLGPDINSSYDEKYYYFDEQDDYVYFARNDDDSVYHIIRTDRPEILESTPLVVVQGNVISMRTTEPLSSEITFNLLPGGRQLASTTSDAGSGGYEVSIPSGYEYKVSVNENGYEPYDKTLFLENRGQQYIYEYDIPLSSVTLVAEKEEKKAPVKLTTPEEILASGIVLFEFNSYIPKDDESFEMIYRIVDFMKENPEYKIEIFGYADPIGRDSYNKKLSKERADRVKKEMVEEGGINPRRIITHGMGSVKTGAPTRDEQTLAIMRKVEFKFTR
jgi:outer membrane protein OmpA-like peptidoglycan-associated protein